jgi:hypothetical protein
MFKDPAKTLLDLLLYSRRTASNRDQLDPDPFTPLSTQKLSDATLLVIYYNCFSSLLLAGVRGRRVIKKPPQKLFLTKIVVLVCRDAWSLALTKH